MNLPGDDAVVRTRLHITPFNEALLERVIPEALRPDISNISYHTVQTSPGPGFGYLEMPTMEADNLIRKLNGSTLKGSKIHIEKAKPLRKRKADAQDDEEDTKRSKKPKKEKTKKEDGVLQGHELEKGRKVKRGWTDGTSSKKAEKAAHPSDAKAGPSKRQKVLFKTTVPSIATLVNSETPKQHDQKKVKPDNATKKRIVVQEFTKSTKSVAVGELHSTRPMTTTYEDGRGWVDEDWNVVEAAPKTGRRKRGPTSDRTELAHTLAQMDSMQNEPVNSVQSGLNEDNEAQVDATDDQQQEHDAPATQSVSEVAATLASTAEPTASAEAPQVHPLEALFKRPASQSGSATKPKPDPIKTSFSFFNAPEADEGNAEMESHPPQTPHTRQDLEWRGLRSAAPTPDTAAFGKRMRFPPAIYENEDDDEDDSEDDEDEGEAAADATEGVGDGDAAAGASQGKSGESDFRKAFYEKRGELNRAWKKRRREERKAKRQRENRRVSRRVV